MKYKLKTIPECTFGDGSVDGGIENNPTRTYQDISKERELLSSLIKMLEGRKKSLDDVIKKYLETHSELHVMGVTYSMSDVTKIEYPFIETRRILMKFFDVPGETIDSIIALTNKKALDEFISGIDAMRSGAEEEIRADLDKISKKTFSKRLNVTRGK